MADNTLGGMMRPAKHTERCRLCKTTVEALLRETYGEVKKSPKLPLSLKPADFAEFPFAAALYRIYAALQGARGNAEFVRASTLPNCDFLVASGFLVEFDESQHFTKLRKLSLELYPPELTFGFDTKRWAALCERTNAHDDTPPFRDEQRAWYDTLRDFAPHLGLTSAPTRRLYSKDMKWCTLDASRASDVDAFLRVLCPPLPS